MQVIGAGFGRTGTLSLRLAGIQKILEGMTTPEEVLRTTVED